MDNGKYVYAPIEPSENLNLRTNYTEESAFWLFPPMISRNDFYGMKSPTFGNYPNTNTNYNGGATSTVMPTKALMSYFLESTHYHFVSIQDSTFKVVQSQYQRVNEQFDFVWLANNRYCLRGVVDDRYV